MKIQVSDVPSLEPLQQVSYAGALEMNAMLLVGSHELEGEGESPLSICWPHFF